MPRAPLFRVLQRSYRLAREAVTTGRSLPDVLERHEERQALNLTRRGFLGGTAAATALTSPLLRPWRGGRRLPLAAARPPRGDAKVVIIGAASPGSPRLPPPPAGVRCASSKRRSGWGRMFSLRDFFPDGQVAELGGELVDTNHVHIQDPRRRAEHPLDDFVLDDPKLSHDVWAFDGRRYSEADVVDAFVPLSARIVRDLARFESDAVSYQEPAGRRRWTP